MPNPCTVNAGRASARRRACAALPSDAHPQVRAGAGLILHSMSTAGAVPERFRPALIAAIDMIAAGDAAAMRADPKIRIHGDDPLLWVRDHPGTLTTLPPEGWDIADAIQLQADPDTCSAVIPLWTGQEGRSDLSLEATVTDLDDGPLITIDDVHVR